MVEEHREGTRVAGLFAIIAKSTSANVDRYDNRMLIDSGAAVHVCPPDYETEYPTHPLNNDGTDISLSTATSIPLKTYGYKLVLYELVPNYYVWVKYVIANVHMPIISVPMLTANNIEVSFQQDRCEIRCGTSSGETEGKETRVPFHIEATTFVLRPYRTISFEEAKPKGIWPNITKEPFRDFWSLDASNDKALRRADGSKGNATRPAGDECPSWSNQVQPKRTMFEETDKKIRTRSLR